MSHIDTWNVELFLSEEDDVTKANAVLTTRKGREVRATGTARRNPQDVAVPEIGDELATARALSALAHQLLEIAALDIEAVTHRPVHLSS
jgi:hypothetical protein